MLRGGFADGSFSRFPVGDRKRHRERTAPARLALDGNTAAVRLDDALDETCLLYTSDAADE